MSDFSYPYKDAEFIFNQLIDFDAMCAAGGLEEVGLDVSNVP